MAQYSKLTKNFLADSKTNFEVVMMSDAYGNVLNPTPLAERDAFGRLRTSDPWTLFESHNVYRADPQFDTAITGSANTVYQVNESVVDLNVTTTAGDKVVRETRRVFPYQPGKSLLCMTTFVFSQPKVGLRQRVGYFGARNGIFLECDGTTCYIVKRSYVSGSVVDTRIPQSEWNGFDKLDGEGPSGLLLDLTKAQIFFCDIEWLGVGAVRCGFVQNDEFFIIHTFKHANFLPTTYMTTPNLPVRYEIENTSATASPSKMKQICSTVISEGGYRPTSRQKVVGRGLTEVTLTTPFTYYNVVALRLKSTNLDAVVVPNNVYMSVDNTQNSFNRYQWKLIVNPTFGTPPVWSSYDVDSSVEYSLTNSTITGGTVIKSGYITSTMGASEITGVNEIENQITRSLAGVSDIVVLAMTSDTATRLVSGEIGFFEL